MNLLIRVTIAAQLCHLGLSQMPMPFPPMPFGMPHMGHPMPMPGMMPAPMHMGMPMSLGMPQQKLPIVVMPYYKDKKTSVSSKKRHQKRRHKKKYCSDSESSDDSSSDTSSSSELTLRRSNGRARRRQVLTPVVSYVTKDGYVVYQKKIKKDRAKDWLQMGKKSQDEIPDEASEEYFTSKDMKKMGSSKKRRHYH